MKSLIEEIETDLPTGVKRLRSMNTGQLQGMLAKLLRMAGLTEEDIATFTAMDPKKAMELLKGVMRDK